VPSRHVGYVLALIVMIYVHLDISKLIYYDNTLELTECSF
jgi:hypothetical protein